MVPQTLEACTEGTGGGVTTPPRESGARRADGARAQRLAELVRLLQARGPMTRRAILDATGWSARSVGGYLATLERDGRVHARLGRPAGPGRPSRVGSAGPDPAAAADDDDETFGLLPDADIEDVLDDHADPEQPQDVVVVAIGEYTTKRPQANAKPMPPEQRQLADRILAALRDEPMCAPRVAQKLGADRRHVRNVIKRLARGGEIEPRGTERNNNNLLSTKYRVKPTLDQAGVTVRHADRTGPVRGRVLRCLRDHGDQTIEQLAARLVLHPKVLAPVVEDLIRDGDVEKFPGMRYGACEAAVA